MGEALDAGLDLGGLVGCFVLIALLAIVSFTFARLAQVLNVSILGFRPFAGVAAAIENVIVGGCNDGIKALEGAAASFESGLIDSLGLLLATPVLLAEGVWKALQYGWGAVIRPLINQLADEAAGLSDKLDALTAAFEARIAGLLAHARAYTDAQLADAAGAFTHYADAAAASAEAAAERYAAGAVEALRSAEEAAIAKASSIAAEARVAGEAAAADVLSKARAGIAAAETDAARLATQARAEAEAAGAAAIAAADAAGKAALSVVAGVADAAEQGVIDLEGLLAGTGWAALIASIPALALLVNTIATEAGLENASCRGKVKQICGTNESDWGNLLGGLAAIGFAFSLRDLAELARPLVAELAPIIEQAA